MRVRMQSWLALILFSVGISMLAVANYLIGVRQPLGYDLIPFSMIPVAIVVALVFLRFERWLKR